MLKKKKLWGGRFKKPTNPLVERYTSSIAVDARLACYDVIGSIAHAKMLGHCRIITQAESRKLVSGLNKILKRIGSGRWKADPSAEDVHTNIQQDLDKIVGSVGRKIHTARSRNDQVALDLRLYCRDVVVLLISDIRNLQRSLVDRAEKYQDIVIPGYTHLQRAQPVHIAHHLLAYVEMLERDIERFADAQKRIDVLPLGSGALSGTSLPIDRKYVAKLLGFSRISENSMDAVSDRDFAVELVSIAASLGIHLSRLSEDIILWMSEEFGIATVDDAFATGSSLMPQKKNPDVPELIRGQAGLVIGQLTGFLTMLKGLPLTYNRDLQWDKTYVFGALEASHDALDVLSAFVRHLKVKKSNVERLLDNDALCATDLAEYLVSKGVAFRDAHRIVGEIVAKTERDSRQLRDLRLSELKVFSSVFDQKALSLMSPYKSVERKKSIGSTGTRLVKRAIHNWQDRLKGK